MKFSITFITLLLLPVTAFSQKGKPVLTFGLIADLQYADCEPAINRYYRNSIDKLNTCVADLNSLKVQFTINLGDIIDRKFKDIDLPLLCLKQLAHKIYHFTGNHDYKDITDNRILYKKLNMPAGYYAFKKKNWTFILLNTNELSSYAHVKGTEKEKEFSALKAHIKAMGLPQGAVWNGGISKQQLHWLKDVLDKSQKDGKNVLIFSHHPLYPQSAFVALNNREILDLIGSYTCVKALFAGHHHAGAFAYYKDIPVVTIEGMVETLENAYGIVEIYEDSIVLKGKGKVTSRKFSIFK